MSEFEIASLDYRTATLAARYAANWIAGASVFIAVLQTGIVAWGIREMVRANRDRARQAEAQARAADQRHVENMRRLDEQSRRFDALIEGQAEQRRASDAQTRALMELVERTALNAPPASTPEIGP